MRSPSRLERPRRRLRGRKVNDDCVGPKLQHLGRRLEAERHECVRRHAQGKATPFRVLEMNGQAPPPARLGSRARLGTRTGGEEPAPLDLEEPAEGDDAGGLYSRRIRGDDCSIVTRGARDRRTHGGSYLG